VKEITWAAHHHLKDASLGHGITPKAQSATPIVSAAQIRAEQIAPARPATGTRFEDSGFSFIGFRFG
jgi:hypothetical protein